MKRLTVPGIFLIASCFSLSALSQVVIEDGGVGMSLHELEQTVSRWAPQMQEAAAIDHGDRLELLSTAMAGKKMAHVADQLTEEADGDLYWEYVLQIQSAKRSFMLKNYLDNIDVPDMTELSKERYETTKGEIARVPEMRTSPQILFKCGIGDQCDRAELRPQAEKVLAELRAGADFNERVTTYSGDPASNTKGGKFDKWMRMREAGVSPPYVDALFRIEKVGAYSELAETQFGFHIIRLDEVKASYYRSYEEMKEAIISALEAEYRLLSIKEYAKGFQISDEAFIDGAAMDTLFNKYKTD